MIGALDVVCARDLMIDVLDTGPVGRKQGDGVVDLVDPEQRRVTDAVADPGIAHPCPELLVASRVGRAQPDMAEGGDTGIAWSKVAPAAVFRPYHQLDRIAGGVAEKDQCSQIGRIDGRVGM